MFYSVMCYQCAHFKAGSCFTSKGCLLQKRVKIIQGKECKNWRAKIYILQGTFSLEHSKTQQKKSFNPDPTILVVEVA